MNRKALVAVLLALLVGGLIVYVSSPRASAPPQVAAEECEDKPPPNEFAMAAECEGDAAPEPGGAAGADPEDGIRR